MGSTDWHIGPVLKDKVGSQGTLFRGGTKYSSDKRYPKGYTPERQAEVANAVVKPSIHVDLSKRRTQTDDREIRTGTASSHYKDRQVRTSEHWDGTPNTYANESAQPTRDLVDNIARSTVPVDHLSGVQFRTNVDQDRLGAPTTAGHYDTRGDAMSNGPVIRLGAGYEKGSTTIHEIGHHVSETQGNEWRKNYSHSTPERGQEEAFADNYADTHFRNQKGKPEPRGTYGGGEYAGHIERSPEFWGGYRTNRHYAPDFGDRHAENEKYLSAFPEERTHPDGSVDQPLIHREREYGGYDQKTGRTLHTDHLGDVNEDAIPSHANHDWSKYHV